MDKKNENEKITLPKDLQIRMLKFFMKTSIPRKMRNERNERKSSNKQGNRMKNQRLNSTTTA